MMKGYVKADAEGLAFALFGAIVGSAVGKKLAPKTKQRWTAGGGAVAATGLRAALDPSLKAERAAGG